MYTNNIRAEINHVALILIDRCDPITREPYGVFERMNQCQLSAANCSFELIWGFALSEFELLHRRIGSPSRELSIEDEGIVLVVVS